MVLGKVKDFLGVISEANKRLQQDAKNLMLGVADLHTREAVAAAESVIPGGQSLIELAGSGSEIETEETSDEGDESDEDEDDEYEDEDGEENNSSTPNAGNNRSKKRKAGIIDHP
ncbi:hypothetical protein Tsubulata_034834 [Turnera subulata]|uniref:Uncharacterized protein n=1 Tax=Turnera subulata TaxID=218843 RepID=A0A9Q0GDC2_9ROSI|nr:hypothetical protein Tsubulata_034834 [Turnera subulata]